MNDNTKTLAELLPNGHTYQNGIRPGERKLEQFRTALAIRQTPPIYSQDGKGQDAIATVKIFNPAGSWTWYITEWDGDTDAFGLVIGHERELGYMDLRELANVEGWRRIGLELDMHWTPRPLRDCK